MKLDVTLKRFFYDRESVRRKLDDKRLKALRKAGAVLRLRARRKLRRRKRPSRPGEPPSVHAEGSFATLKNIQFGFDTVAEAAIVGAIKIPAKAGSEPAPGVMEHGGPTSVDNPRRTIREIGKPCEIDVDGKSGRRRARRDGVSTKNVVDWQGKTRRVTYARIETAEQARRANEFNEMLFGPLAFTVGTVAPRPFMAPAAQEASGEFLDLYLKEG